jgi:hypothetical protein
MANKYFVNVAVGADTDVECPVKFTGETKALGAMAFRDVIDATDPAFGELATLDVDDLNLGTVASADKAANVAAVATADGSDADTTQALANALKVTVNAILTALKTSGIMIDDT